MLKYLSRRGFLEMTAAAGGTLLAGGMMTRPLHAVQGTGWPEMPMMKVYVVYLGLGGAWPRPDFDAPREIREKFAPYLTKLQRRLGDVEFTGGDLIANQAQATSALVPKIKQARADAILVIHLAFGDASPFKITMCLLLHFP